MTETNSQQPQHFVVGGMYYKGTEDHSEEFFEHGDWEMRPDSPRLPKFLHLIKAVRPGDFIALKRKLIRKGFPQQIRVMARGVVLEAADNKNRIRVQWIEQGLDLLLPGNQCMDSIHGPFDIADPWTKQVFGVIVPAS